MRSFADLASLYRGVLFDDVIPFWLQHSLDRAHGGYLTCLERDGSAYDTDKFVWLQARQVWTLSMLYNRVGQVDEWLAAATSGAEFLLANGRDQEGNWYFSLDREGRPLVQPYSIFSDCFAAIAFAQFATASGDQEARDVARQTYANVLRRRPNPKGRYDKTVPGARPLRSLALPMILSNAALELEDALGADEVDGHLDTCTEDLTGLFLDRDRRLMFEHVAPDGSRVDSFEGRLINPGHTLEAMWFLMDIARRRADQQLIDLAVDVVVRTLEFGWDSEHGGVFYFKDVQGRPTQQLEWDQKLWWVHLEALVALSMAYRETRREDVLVWLERVHDYAWERFPDPAYGEWYGYLNRRGEPLLSLKGGKWKGCFHVPRALFRCANEFESLASDSRSGGDAQ